MDILMHELAEQYLIGAILTDGNTFARVTDIEPKDFGLLRHQYIWEAFQSLHDAKKTIDIVTVIQSLQVTPNGTGSRLKQIGGNATLYELMNNGGISYNWQEYAETVKVYAVARQLLAKFSETSSELHAGKSTVYDALQETIATTQHLSAKLQPVEEDNTAASVVDEIYGDILAGEPVKAYPTGINPLDKVLNGGGLKRTNFVIVAGRPGDGKTALLKQMAVHMAQQTEQVTTVDTLLGTEQTSARPLRIVYFNFESTKRDLITRMLSQLTGINSRYISNAKPPPNPHCKRCNGRGVILSNGEACLCYKDYETKFHEKIRTAQQKIHSWDLDIIDNALSGQQFEAKLRSEHHKRPVDVVFVDYIQRGKKVGKQSDYEMITDFSQRCADLAKELNLIVIAGVQFNREGATDTNVQTEKRPQLHHIKGSGQIEQDVHVALAPVRPYNADGTRSNEAKLYLMKQREGSADIPPIQAMFVPDKLSFEIKAH